VICTSGLRTAAVGLYFTDSGTSVMFISGLTQQFANDKRKLESATNNKHFDVQGNKETFSEQKTDDMENTTVRSAMKLQYDCDYYPCILKCVYVCSL